MIELLKSHHRLYTTVFIPSTIFETYFAHKSNTQLPMLGIYEYTCRSIKPLESIVWFVHRERGNHPHSYLLSKTLIRFVYLWPEWSGKNENTPQKIDALEDSVSFLFNTFSLFYFWIFNSTYSNAFKCYRQKLDLWVEKSMKQNVCVHFFGFRQKPSERIYE